MARSAHPVHYCEGCGIRGRTAKLRRVPVEPMGPTAPNVGALVLCHGCATRDGRCWRLRWRPEEGQGDLVEYLPPPRIGGRLPTHPDELAEALRQLGIAV